LNNSLILANLQPYFDRILTMTKGIAMYISTRSSQPLARRNGFARLAEWWPAAAIGLLAILGGGADGNAQTFLSLL
jgi:hypothetical protein